jgi:signal transduction histidine kinase
VNPATPSPAKDSLEHFAILGMQTASLLHEVNNKLTVICGTLDLFALENLDPRCQERCGILAKAMEGVVDLVREAGALVAGRTDSFFHAEPIAVDELLERLCGVDPPALLGTSGLVVTCDPRKTSRALADVVRNAWQAGAAHVRMDVNRIGSTAVIRVVDDGPGIPRDVADRLFSPGVTHGKIDGHGLGLFSARWIFEAMGGSLRLERSDVSGTCFRITLPLTDSEA